MTNGALETVRAELERLPHGRPSRPFDETDAEVSTFAEDARKRFRAGDELRTWDDVDRRFYRSMPEENVLSALHELAQNDLDGLLRLFSTSNPLAVHILAQFLPWSDDFAERWVCVRTARHITALGVLRWLRQHPRRTRVDETDDAFSLSLDRLATSLQTQPRSDEVALWWQILGIAYRLSPAETARVSGRMRLLYEKASVALACAGGSDALPATAEFEQWASGNPEIAAVLPFVAHRAPANRHALLAAFFSDVQRRLDGELHEIPDVARGGGLLYVNACGHAIAMQMSDGVQAAWWAEKLDTYLTRLVGWEADLSAAAIERAAWITCATSIAALKLASAQDDAWRLLLDEMYRRVEGHIAEWLWALGYPASARVALPELLVRAACLEPASAASRVMIVARAARDSTTLRVIQKEAGGVLPKELTDEVDRLLVERAAYEDSLGLSPSGAREA